ncbi:DUF4385 family protein [Pedobacter sp. WC2423]|uniref:DUF4385 family protein n=1 Tax=Pedobacter sp. WC2423 TaxID=3234142 RepID=UPI003466896C
MNLNTRLFSITRQRKPSYLNNGYTQLERGTGETEKAASAAIFYKKWKAAEADIKYAKMKSAWKKERG